MISSIATFTTVLRDHRITFWLATLILSVLWNSLDIVTRLISSIHIILLLWFRRLYVYLATADVGGLHVLDEVLCNLLIFESNKSKATRSARVNVL